EGRGNRHRSTRGCGRGRGARRLRARRLPARRPRALRSRAGRPHTRRPRVAPASAAGDLRGKILEIAAPSDRREGTPGRAAGDVAWAVETVRRPPPRAVSPSKEAIMNIRTLMAAAGALVLSACSPSNSDTGNASAHGDAHAPPVRSELLVSAAWLADHLDDPGVVVLHVAPD